MPVWFVKKCLCRKRWRQFIFHKAVFSNQTDFVFVVVVVIAYCIHSVFKHLCRKPWRQYFLHIILYKYFKLMDKNRSFLKPIKHSFLFFIKFTWLLFFVAVTGKLWPELYEIKVTPIKSIIEEGMVEKLCLPKPFNSAWFIVLELYLEEWAAKLKVWRRNDMNMILFETKPLLRFYSIIFLQQVN